MVKSAISLLAAAGLLTGCIGREPVRTRWAEGSTPLDEASNLRLSISSIAAETTATKARDLPDAAAAAYLTALGTKLAGAEEFRAAAADAIKPGKRGDADRTVLSRTIAIGLSKRGYSATRRLLLTRVTMVPQNFVFAGYTLAKSEYQLVDLENVALSRTTTAKVAVAPKFGSVVEAGEASLTQENKEGTTYVNRERTETLSIDYRPDRIELYQRGTAGSDLTGQLLLNASVRPLTLDAAEYETVVGAHKIVAANGADLPPAKASMTTVVDKILRSQPLIVCAGVDYVERRVVGGAQFVDEGRQRVVEERSLTAPRMYELIAGDQVAPPLWGVVTGAGFLAVDTSRGPQSFSFANEVDATRFASWMARTGAAKVGRLRLYGSTVAGVEPLSVLKGRDVRVQALQTTAVPFRPRPCSIMDE